MKSYTEGILSITGSVRANESRIFRHRLDETDWYTRVPIQYITNGPPQASHPVDASSKNRCRTPITPRQKT